MKGQGRMILVPALITLAITLLRLTGELLGWSETLFSDAAGGGMALIGIAWLPPIFGIYFSWRLVQSGGYTSAGATIGWPLLAVLIVMAAGMIGFSLLGQTSIWALIIFAGMALAVLPLARKGWQDLFSVLLLYAFAARIPVVLVMLAAIAGRWGTHYDALPPEFPEMGWFSTWVLVGVIPQFTIWITFTVVVGMIFGGIGLLFFGWQKQAA